MTMFGSAVQKDHKLDAARDALTLSDYRRPDNPLIYVNQGFEKLTGYTREEAVGRNCRFLQGPQTDRRAAEQIRLAIEAQRPLIIDLLNYRKDGSTFWNRFSISPVLGPDGKATHFIGIQTDITVLKSLEERLGRYAAEL